MGSRTLSMASPIEAYTTLDLHAVLDSNGVVRLAQANRMVTWENSCLNGPSTNVTLTQSEVRRIDRGRARNYFSFATSSVNVPVELLTSHDNDVSLFLGVGGPFNFAISAFDGYWVYDTL